MSSKSAPSLPYSPIESLKIKAKILQKKKARAGTPIALKDALNQIAIAGGYPSWRDLKANLDLSSLFIRAPSSPFYKTWYSRYDEAVHHLEQGDGFLIPYQRQYFICDSHYIEHLGIDLNDPDLGKVGCNWAQPKDPDAWNRILKKLRQEIQP